MELVPYEQRRFKPKRYDVHTYVRLTPRIAICLINGPEDASLCDWIKAQHEELTELISLAKSSAPPETGLSGTHHPSRKEESLEETENE